ncbi:hypothetical protein ACF0H5_007794 [Mactra antiquata]
MSNDNDIEHYFNDNIEDSVVDIDGVDECGIENEGHDDNGGNDHDNDDLVEGSVVDIDDLDGSGDENEGGDDKFRHDDYNDDDGYDENGLW